VGCRRNPQMGSVPKNSFLFVEKLCFSTTRGLDRGAEAPRGVRVAEMNSATRGWDLSSKILFFAAASRQQGTNGD
jgi:hypothetical protein